MGERRVGNIMFFVLVTSGKGGTGKTLFSLSLAKELSKRGIKASVLDSDLDDSNTMQLLGMKEGEVGLTGDKRFVPMAFDGIEIFAMPGISGTKPVSMDGSEYAEIVHDVVDQTEWHSDYCIVDMPAGNADIFRTMVLAFSDSLLGSIVVMQPAHVESAKRTLELNRMVGVPTLGVVENMSGFKCDCGKEHPIFGTSALDEVAKGYGVEPLGRIPLSMEIKGAIDRGQPFLSGESAKPVERAAGVVLAAKPVEPELFERLKRRAKGFARGTLMDLMTGFVGIINTEIPIRDYQTKYAFPGGRTVELDVTDRSMRKVNAQMFFRIEDGILKVVKNPKRVDTEIRIWDSAFIWSVLGRRRVGDEQVPYDFFDCWLLGEAKFFGFSGSTQQAVCFFRDVWKDLSQRVRSNKRLMGILERLA